MDLYHRNAEWLISPDYFSRLGVDMEFDPLSRVYVEQAAEFCRLYAPVSGPMRPENMPGYREPKICSKLKSKRPVTSVQIAQDVTIAPLLTSIMHDRSGGHESCLQIVPILTGHLTEEEQKSMKFVPMHNHDIAFHAAGLPSFAFAVYGFNSGHFLNKR